MKEHGIYEQLTQLAYLPIYFKLLRGAMELNVFSHLTVPVTAEHLARDLGWHEANTRMLLDALFSLGFVKKSYGGYVNAPETAQYLVVSSPDYAGGFLTTYIQEGLAPLDVAKLVREGPDPAGRDAGFHPLRGRLPGGAAGLPPAGGAADHTLPAGRRGDQKRAGHRLQCRPAGARGDRGHA